MGIPGACTGEYCGLQEMTGAYSGTIGMCTGDKRAYRSCVQRLTGVAQGITVKTQRVTGKDRGFSYGHGFLEPVV